MSDTQITFGIKTGVEPKADNDRAIGFVFMFWRWWVFIGWERGCMFE